jgi:4-amino-4-deoxy-L-arabinose transferase-like glycosyltransferase
MISLTILKRSIAKKQDKMSATIHFFLQIYLRFLNFLFSYPYITLLLWTLPLLLFHSQQESLMAHDEGIYAWRARWILESGGWLNPEIIHYGKTPGIYWLIASSFSLLGVSESAARLPTLIFSLSSVILLYEIVKIIVDRKTAWLAAAILSVEALWLQYSRLCVPDVPMVCLFLFGLFSLLKAESNDKKRSHQRGTSRSLWLFLAGLGFGLGFLVRSYLIFIPILALTPYLLWKERNTRSLRSPWLYLGLFIGLLPTIIWLFAPLFTGKASTFKDSFNFIVRLGSEERNNNNFFYYLWNVPLRAFPWSLFAIFGGFICWRKFDRRCQLLLVIAPLLILLQLSIFSTRIPHYAMSLYPFVAILGSIALLWLTQGFDRHYFSSIHTNKTIQFISYLGGSIGLLLVFLSIIANFVLPLEVANKPYLIIAFSLGLGWMSLSFIWLRRNYFRHRTISFSRFWIGGWLLGAWLAFAAAGSLGFWNNYNPDFKSFIYQPEIAVVIEKERVNSVALSGNISSDKTVTLIRYYTPLWGKDFKSIRELPKPCYAWVRSQDLIDTKIRFKSLGKIRDWQLIRIVIRNE